MVLGKKSGRTVLGFKLIKAPSDIFKLNYSKIKNLEGWGDLSIENLKKAIEKSKKITLDKIYLFYRYKTHWSRKCENN